MLSEKVLNELSLDLLYLILSPLGIVYFFLFIWTYKLLKKDENDENLDHANSPSGKLVRDTAKSEDQNNKNEIMLDNVDKNENFAKEDVSNEDGEQKENINNLDDMNKLNQVMNYKNVITVMKMCGLIIISTGVIYFIFTVCKSCILIKVCNRLDFPFLPVGTSIEYQSITNITTNETIIIEKEVHTRKGKYEFTALFFEVGGIIAKTFIKLVRRIKPIEIYTFIVLFISIVYIFEYYFGFIPYYILVIFHCLLGFFSGGAYSAGFILFYILAK